MSKETKHEQRLAKDNCSQKGKIKQLLKIKGYSTSVSIKKMPIKTTSSKFALVTFSSVQFSRSVMSDSVTTWIAARQASLSITNSQSLPKLMSIESVMPSRHRILCCPLLLLPPIPPSIRVFSNESALHMRWPKYWSFSFNISPFNEHPGLISFRMDRLDLLAVRVFSSKASILWRSAFFTVQLSHPYMTTGKTIALTRRTFDTISNGQKLGCTSDLWVVFWLQFHPSRLWNVGAGAAHHITALLSGALVGSADRRCWRGSRVGRLKAEE